MADTLTKARRSWNMSRIKGKDTGPEMIVRSLLHRMGFRFRLQQRIAVADKSGKRKAESPGRTGHGMLPQKSAKSASTSGKKTVKPDIILPKLKTALFVHGCFWHRHRGCKDATMPKSRTEWWRAKLEGNAERDKRNQTALRRSGWRVITVWECETEKPEKLKRRLERLFRGTR
jgi:DNA mismatch endonuclease (patch repair protein)